jgi:chitin synthase
MMSSFVSALPLQVPGTFYTALSVIRAFTHCVTPNNPSLPRYSSLATQCTLNQEGDLLGVSFALSTSGLDTQNGLLKIPAEAGYRAFDVFYYLNVSSASPAERDFLGLKPCSAYSLLRRSGTYSPPSYLPTADDAAAAEDFRNSLRAIGIRGPAMHNLISTLAGILKLGDTLDAMADADAVYNICDEAAVLLDMDPTVLRVKCTSEERGIFVAGLYESVVDWVIRHANNAIKEDMKSPANGSGPGTPRVDDINEDTVCINVIEVPDSNLGKAIAFRTVFDDTQGINLEMKEDGVPVVPAGATVLNEMKAVVAACGPDLGEMDSAAGRERDMERDRREGILERIAHQCEDGFLKELLHPIPNQGVVLGEPQSGRVHLSSTLNSSRVWFHLSLHPTDEPPSTLAEPGNHWSAAAVSGQLRAWRLPEWANRRNRQLDFTADFDPVELVDRYASLGCNEGREGIETWLLERGWTNGEVVIGETRIWLRESAWWEAECMKDALPPPGTVPLEATYAAPTPAMESSFFSDVPPGSRDQLLTVPRNSGSTRPTSVATPSRRLPGDYSLGTKGDQYKGEVTYEGQDPELGDGKVVQEKEVGFGRRLWVAIAWILTIWMPSPFLRYIGRMKRPDVRLAWREKVSLVFIILLINATVVFYIIFFGKLLCPNWDKAWDTTQVGFHQGTNDYWVSHRGKVYDLTKFYKIQHSDTNIAVTNDVMMTFAGTNIDPLVAPPLTIACPNLVTDETLILTSNATVTNPTAIHMQGPFFQPDPLSKLRSISWYTDRFLPTMNKYHKGDLVWDINYVRTQGQAGYSQWVIINGDVYDLTDYFNTKLNVRKNVASYAFFPSWFEDMVQGNNGADVTELFNGEGNKTSKAATMQCLKNYFYTGPTDYRKTPRCQVNNYILLAFTVILCTVILTKFLAALQLGSKRQPARQDKFVICQVPAYTEGEEQLRNGLDSLTALAYDNKRKLICVICDGVIVGKGNDRPTAKLVLDILGVDPKTDAPALPFKSVGQGSEQLNYGKVYSGLYEFEGNVVPYLVVVKVGKESEQNKPKPGNRGKRDSQIVLMSFLNRVHHRSPMSPLELEMFHQINNVIGVDPELYEYLLMVDADTMVKEDSLNRLVAACANDSKIAGICGETSLQNQERSWWTMIQVYEYYISHHLAKAFESLFGSVTCLPGW